MVNVFQRRRWGANFLVVPLAIVGSAALHVLAAGVISNLDWRVVESPRSAELAVHLSASASAPATAATETRPDRPQEAAPMPVAQAPAAALAAPAVPIELARPELAATLATLPRPLAVSSPATPARIASQLSAPWESRASGPTLPIASTPRPIPALAPATISASPTSIPAAAPPQPPSPAVGVSTDYRSQVLALLAAAKTYPTAARRRGEVGVVRLAVEIAADGGVADVAVLAGSGFRRLDHAAVSMVTRCSPLPPPPASMRLEFSVLYELSD